LTSDEFKPSRDVVTQIIAAVHLYDQYANASVRQRQYNVARYARDLRNARALIYKAINSLVRPKLVARGGRRTDALFERVYLAGWTEAAQKDDLVRLANRDCQLRLRPHFHC